MPNMQQHAIKYSHVQYAKKYAKYAKKYVKHPVYVNHFPKCKNYANYAAGTLLIMMCPGPTGPGMMITVPVTRRRSESSQFAGGVWSPPVTLCADDHASDRHDNL